MYIYKGLNNTSYVRQSILDNLRNLNLNQFDVSMDDMQKYHRHDTT